MADSTDEPVRPVIWARPERAGKGPAPAHSRAEIATAAITLADKDGSAAVTMRNVALALGIGATSLYRYVDSKDEIFDLMIDAVEGEDGGPAPLTGNWRTDLEAFAHRLRTILHRHPWLTTLGAGRPVMGPNTLASTEQTLSALDDLGVGIDEALLVLEVVEAFVRGYTLGELSDAADPRGRTAAQWQAAHTPYLRDVIDAGEHPHLERVIRRARTPHAEDRADRGFVLGLNRILDGVHADASVPEHEPES